MRRSLPLLLIGLFVVLAGIAVPLRLARGDTGGDVVLAPVFATYVAAGALVVTRARGNVVGWLLIASAEFAVVGLFTQEYARRALIDAPGSLPLGEFATWVYLWSWLGMLAPLVFILFLLPDGRLPSAHWRLPFVVVCGVLGLAAILFAFGQPGDVQQPALRNPFLVPALAPLYELMERAFVIYVASFGLAVAALFFRYRRSQGAERLQLKWSMYTAVYALAAVAVANLVPDPLNDAFWVTAVGSIPVGISIDLLRYRLYDIDVVIERTLVYGALTGMLGAVYVGAVLGAQELLGPVTGGNEIAVAVSTLLVVALFQPLRRRVQRTVDRRFYRARYDAHRTLDAFAARVRDSVDLQALEAELLGVVDRTLKPAEASIWLRDGSDRSP